MGRAGSGSQAEFLIAVMVSFLFAMLFSFVVPLALLVRGIERIFSLLTGLFLISLALLILTPLGFPYSGETGALAPQRFMMAVRTLWYDVVLYFYLRCAFFIFKLKVKFYLKYAYASNVSHICRYKNDKKYFLFSKMDKTGICFF